LMVTPFGATLHVSAVWNPPPDVDLTLWQHIASYGRDQYVRVGHRGFVFPYGHHATVVTVSERRFLPASGDAEQAVAYLVPFFYFWTRQLVGPSAGLDLPFTELEFVTRIPPVLTQPQPFPESHAAWIFAEDKPFLFDVAAVDLLGRHVRFRVPAIFIEADSI